MGYLAFTIICYKDSGGGAILKAGDQYSTDERFKVVAVVGASART